MKLCTLLMRVAISLVASAAPVGALACGYCVEDRIAAVYDHALNQRVTAERHGLVYLAWDGPVERTEASRLKLLALGEAVAGVDKGSVRVSMEPAAIALSFDPRRTSADAISIALQKKLRELKLVVIPLQMQASPGR